MKSCDVYLSEEVRQREDQIKQIARWQIEIAMV